MLRIILATVLIAVAAPAAAQTVTLRAQNNMFVSNVVLNNQVNMRALIDTGASFLSMCHATAKAMGLTLGDSLHLHTANGIITARRAMVQSVRIGALEVRH